VTVTKIIDNGLLVKFLDSFHGVIDAYSLGTFEPTKNWQAHIAEDDLIYARIMFVDHSNKAVRLSYRSHLLDMKVPSALPRLGELIHHLEVFQVMRKTGVYLTRTKADDNNNNNNDTNNNDDRHDDSTSTNDPYSIGVFIHTSNLSAITSTMTEDELEQVNDDEGVTEGNINSLYSSGVLVPKARVLGYHLVEGVVIASNKLKHLKLNAVTHWSNIKLGEVHQAVITSVEDIGLRLVIKDKIHAFCPVIHTSDVVNLSSLKLQTKFKVGNKIKIRIWQIKKNGSIIVTHKKSFVEENEGQIFTYRDMIIGKVGMGCITRVHSDEGLRIHFYNGMRGFIPRQILLKQGVTDVTESYRIGQGIKCVFLGKYKSKDIVYKVSKGDEGAREIIFLSLNLGNPAEILLSLQEEMKRLVGDATNLLSHHERDTEDDDNHDNDYDYDGHDTTIGTNAHEYDPSSSSSSSRLVSGVLSKVEDNALRVVLDDGRVGSIKK
jgi:hypothetical protein